MTQQVNRHFAESISKVMQLVDEAGRKLQLSDAAMARLMARAQATASSLTTSNFNALPDIPEATFHIEAGKPQTISLDQLVVQTDGDHLEFVEVSLVDPTQGSIMMIDSQTFEFTPAEGFTGDVQLDVAVAETGNDIVGHELTSDDRANLRTSGLLGTVEGAVQISVAPEKSYSATVTIVGEYSVNVVAAGPTDEDVLAALDPNYLYGAFPKAIGFTGEIALTSDQNDDGTYTITARDEAGLVDTIVIVISPTEPTNVSDDTGEYVDAIAVDQWQPTDVSPYDARVTLADGTSFQAATSATTEDAALKALQTELLSHLPGVTAYSYNVSFTTVENADGSHTLSVRNMDTGYGASANVVLTPSSRPSTVNGDGLTLAQWQQTESTTRFGIEDLRADDLGALEFVRFDYSGEGVEISQQPDGTFALDVSADVIGTRDVTVVWSDPVTVEEQTSILRVQARPQDRTPPETVEIGVEAYTDTDAPAQILYRPAEGGLWVQIADIDRGMVGNDPFHPRTDDTLAGGDYILVYGDQTGSTHPLVGTTAAPPADAIAGTVTATDTGAVLRFTTDHTGAQDQMPLATVFLTDPRLTTEKPVEMAPANVDATAETALVSRRDYTLEYTYTYDEEQTNYGSQGPISTQSREGQTTLGVTITGDMVVDEATAAAVPSLNVGDSIAGGLTKSQLFDWANHLLSGRISDFKSQRYADGRWSVQAGGTAEFKQFTHNPYEASDNFLVSFGLQQGGADTTPSAFFIQGDNQLLSGRNGDTLGVITLEVYPSATEVRRVTTEAEGQIRLTSAYAVDNGTGAITEDLSPKFFIRPALGLDGQFEIGLEADQHLLLEDFAGETIVLEVEGTDATTGETYTSKIYFNPAEAVVEGQTVTSLQLVNQFESSQTLTGSVPVTPGLVGPDDPVRNSEGFLGTTDTIGHEANDVIRDNWQGRYTYPPEVEVTTGRVRDTIQITSGTADVHVDGSLVTYFGEAAQFADYTIGTIGSTAQVTWGYELPYADVYPQFTGPGEGSWSGSFTETRDIEAVRLSDTMSEADKAVFNAHFTIVEQDGAYQIIQTAYLDPTTPLNVSLDLQLVGGAVVTTPLAINNTAIKFPGRDIEETLTNPDLVESAEVPAGLLGDALTDVDGNYNVVIGGTTVTPDLLTKLSSDLVGIIPSLLEDEAALKDLLRAAGHTDEALLTEMVAKLRDADALHTLAAVAPGIVSLEDQDVPTVVELLADDTFLGAERLEAYLTGKRNEIVAENFPGLTAQDLAGQLIGQIFGLEVAGGTLTGEGIDSALVDNIESLDVTLRQQFARNWIGLATLIDTDTTNELLTLFNNDPDLVEDNLAETLGSLVDAAALEADLNTDKFMVYYADGELSKADIDAILQDEGLVDEFLLAVQGTLIASGVETPLSPTDSVRLPAQFAVDALNLFSGIDKYASDGNLTTKQAAARGFLIALSEGKDFVGLFKNLSVETGLTAFASVGLAAQQYFDIDAYKDEVKKDYGNNRGDARTFSANIFFSFGRVGAMIANSALAQDATPFDNFTVAVDIIAAYGTTDTALRRLAEYASTGNAAEQIAANSTYFIAKESGGEVKLVAAKLGDVVDRTDEGIAAYTEDRRRLQSLTPSEVTEADGTKTTLYYAHDKDGDFLIEDGQIVKYTVEERKALAARVTSQVLIDEGDAGFALYSKVEAKDSLAALGERTEKLTKGVKIAFAIDDSIATAVITAGLGNQVTVDGKDFFVDQELWDKSLAHKYQASIVGAEIGSTVTLDGLDVVVTDGLSAAATNAAASVAVPESLSDELAQAVVAAGPGKSVTVGGLAYFVDDDLWQKSLAHVDPAVILDANIGETVKLGGQSVTITAELQQLATNVAISDEPVQITRKIPYAREGASSIRERLIREFLGLDQLQQGVGRIGEGIFGPKASNADLSRLQKLGQRVVDVGAGTTRIAAGIARAANGWVDFAAIALDVYTVVQAFKGDDTLTKGLSLANLFLTTAGAGVTLGAILGPAVIGTAAFAALGPVGVAVIAATVLLAVLGPVLQRAFGNPPTNAEVFGDLVGFLTGNNSFAANALQGPNVVFDASYTEITYVNDELRIPLNATEAEIAQFIGDLYDDGSADWVLQLLGLYRQSLPA